MPQKFDNQSKKKSGKWISDVIAGLTTGVVNIPDGMANGILAGVGPINGLYSLMFGSTVGSIVTSSEFMGIGVTSAMSLIVGRELAGKNADLLIPSLVTIVLLVGLIQLLFGVFKLGWLTRFVSNAVMTGFLSGVAILIILSQLPELVGYNAEGSNKLFQTVDLLSHLNQVHLATLIVGLASIVLILLLQRTRIEIFAMIIAIVIVSVTVWLANLTAVETVGKATQIPSGFPLPVLPNLSLIPSAIVPAISLAFIGLIQGAGISRAYPNPDGRYPNISRDFLGQGIANTLVSFFKALPVGASVGSTVVNISAGARSRWAGIFSGLFVIVITLTLSPAINLIPIPTMAAILIVAAYPALNIRRITDVWVNSIPSRLFMSATFVGTLLLPIQYAVLMGIALSAIHHLFKSAMNTKIVELVIQKNGSFFVQTAPKELTSNSITLLTIYGSLFYASAYSLEEKMPSARNAKKAVVILRLRGLSDAGSTFIGVLQRYSGQLAEGGGKLILTGVSKTMKKQLERSGDILATEDVYPESDVLRTSTTEAVAAANKWLQQKTGGDKI
jgi:sulfate permease, SulP family